MQNSTKQKQRDRTTKQKKRCNSEWCEYCRVNGSNGEQKGRKKEEKMRAKSDAKFIETKQQKQQQKTEKTNAKPKQIYQF